MLSLARCVAAFLILELSTFHSGEALLDPCEDAKCPAGLECRPPKTANDSFTCEYVEKDKKPSPSPVNNICQRARVICPRGTTCKPFRDDSYFCEVTDKCKIIRCPPGRKCVTTGNSWKCEAIDVCKVVTCPEGTTCTNVGRAAYFCKVTDICKSVRCPAGHKCVFKGGTDYSCDDINECVLTPSKCKFGERCVNTMGSYHCSCSSGFTRNYFTDSCVDIDECAPGQMGIFCSWRCVNTIGSFKCSCPRGYKLGSRGFFCNDINECRRDPNMCSKPGQTCVNTYGGHKCVLFPCFPPYYFKVHPNRCVKRCSQGDFRCIGLIDRTFRYWTYSLRDGARWKAVTFNYRIIISGYLHHVTVRYRFEHGNEGGEFSIDHNPRTNQVELYNNHVLNGPRNYTLKFVGEVMDKEHVTARYSHTIYVFVSRYKF